MRRFFIPSADLQQNGTVDLAPELVKHIRSVLRLPVGMELELLDGRGGIARCRLETLGTGTGSATVLDVQQIPPPPLRIELVQGMAKGDKLDLVLQKGTELGAGRFIICPMERSIGRLKEERLAGRIERWQRIVQEASRQCGQTHLPSVETARALPVGLAACRGDLKLMLWEEETQPLPDILPETAPSSISVLVGPEGGLSQSEAELARQAGFRSVRLGPRILRTETAGLAIISVLQYLYGDLASGMMAIRTPLAEKDPL